VYEDVEEQMSFRGCENGSDSEDGCTNGTGRMCVCLLANDRCTPKKLLSLMETVMNAKAMGTLDPMSHAFVNASLCQEFLSSVPKLMCAELMQRHLTNSGLT